MRRASGLVAAVIVGAFMLAATSTAEAALVLRLCDITDTTCVDVADGSGSDLNPADGAITFIGSFGGFEAFTVNSAFSKPVIGSEEDPQLDVFFSGIGSGAGHIYASDNEFTGIGSATFNFGGTTTGTVRFGAWGGTSNDLFDFTNRIGDIEGPFGPGPFSGSGGGEVVGNDANPYSLTLGVEIVQESGITTGDAHLIVPEPTTLALFGLSLFGFGVAARRRQTSV